MAGDMAAHDYLGHISSDGRSPTQRMSAFGYPASSLYTGEDLAAGYASAAAVLAGWQTSAAHNSVLLGPSYDSIGVGLGYNAASTYKWYWAADFGGAGGTIRVIVPAPPPAPPAAAAQRAAPASRSGPTDDTAAPEETSGGPADTAAETAVDPQERLWARRIDHLFALLTRMGWL